MYDRTGTPEPRDSAPNAYDFYVRGAKKILEKNYRGAIAQYDRAIRLNPNFVEAYLKRAEVRHKLGDDRGALEDCRLALAIDPNYSDAYYYQGRARYRLGYTQSAIEAYNQAIAIEPDDGQAYYHRGVAHHDLNEMAMAVKDWQTAIAMFQAQGDGSGYKLARDSLRRLKKQRWRWGENPLGDGFFGASRIAGMTLLTLWDVARNPNGGLLNAYLRLDRGEAVAVGTVFAAIANCAFITGAFWGWRKWFIYSFFDLLLVGLVPFLALTVLGAIARFSWRRSGSWAGDIFVAGLTVLPTGFLALASAFSTQWGLPVAVALTVLGSSYTVLILYHGCTQINNLPESVAAIATPLFLLIAGWLTYIAFSALFF
nr:tetratricopeptide repeat protein [Oscillatoria sp. FACHB-1406]